MVVDTMANKTKKSKLDRLEQELAQARKVIAEQSDYINQMHEVADNSFAKSPYRKQLEDKINMLEMKLKSSERAKEHAEKMAKARDERLQEIENQYKDNTYQLDIIKYEKLEAENIELKEQIKELKENKHNKRGAGRKPKFTNAEIQSIKMYRLQGKSYKAISEMFNCSVGTIYNVCMEIKNI